MSEKILVPVLGESITEATVSKWLKNEGDRVEVFGINNSVVSTANSISTIPYEILSCLNRRIKRIYLNP